MSPAKHIVIGRFGRTHGLKGWLRVNSETDPAANILDYQPWFIKRQSEYKELCVTGSMMQSDVLLVHIEGFNSPEDAKMLSGIELLIKREQLPNLTNDEFYWADLQGLEVITTHNARLGVIDYMMEAGACDVMVITGNKEYLVPFDRDNVVKSVDFEQGKIIVDWDLEP